MQGPRRRSAISIPGIRHLRPMDALRIYLGIALMIKGVYFIMNMAELESHAGERPRDRARR